MGEKPRVVIVRGASSGIGEATAKRLTREPGAEPVFVARPGPRVLSRRPSPMCSDACGAHRHGGPPPPRHPRVGRRA